MASQQVNAAKLKSTGVNLTNLAAKMKSEMNVSYRITCNNGNQRTLINP